jgi:hypothetical protein
MTGAPPLASPGSRILASWWRQLTPWKPRSLWMGLLLLHRVEAPVRVVRFVRPDPLLLLVLKALALEEDGPHAPGPTLEQLDSRLQVGGQVLGRLVHRLKAAGLAQATAEGVWALTALGRATVDRGEYLRDEYDRQVFYFLERGPAVKPPHYINFPPHLASPWPATENWEFDVRVLEACLRQPVDWKQRHGFPQEVEEILGLAPSVAREAGLPPETGPAPRPLEPWQRVILDRPEQLLAVLVLTGGEGGERLLGFTLQQEGWVLKSTEPAFAVNADWQEVLGAAADAPPPEQWRQAWRNWCRPRAVPLADADACELVRRDHRLQVLAPSRLLERLRASRSDALRGEAWVLAGEGPLRAAALLEIVETRPAPGGK